MTGCMESLASSRNALPHEPNHPLSKTKPAQLLAPSMTAISDFSTERRCLNCFAAHEDTDDCPACSFGTELSRPHYALPRNTLLQGRYLTGRILNGASNEFILSYRALDTRSNAPMVVREYFPRELARRLEGTAIAGPGSMKEAPSYSFGLKSFIGEARELRGLFDPHVISIRHIFEENGTAYVVEDYCEARTLAGLMDSSLGRLSEDDALALVMPLLDTLEAAHHKQLPHLDLRPENILVRSTTEPVLIGFAGARIGLAERTLSLQSLPSSGCTPIERFLSSREMGPWTDVYGVAAILYRLLTGANVPEAAERSEADSLVPVAEILPEGSTRIAAAIMLALRVNRKERPQNIGQFRRMLLPDAELRDGGDVDVRSRPNRLGVGSRMVGHFAKLGFAVGGLVYLAILLYVGITSLVNTNAVPAGDQVSPPPEAESALPRSEARGVLPSAPAAAGIAEPPAAPASGEDFHTLLGRAETGTVEDWFKLASAYEEGQGTPKSIKKAIKWYRMSAEGGLPQAQAALARIYVTGQDGQHRAEGLRWYRRAAEQDFADAQFALGTLLELGLAAPADMAEAIRWYRAAAENGHPMAQNRLGKLYDEGQGVDADDETAVAWYRRAAEQGNGDAQYNLALMYQSGEGVPADRGEAVHWLQLSAAAGNESAKQMLKKWQARN